MYAMTETRPDIAHAVSEVSLFAANPGAPYLEAVKRIFRYTNGTPDLSLVFRGDKTQQLVGYMDADWGKIWAHVALQPDMLSIYLGAL